VAFADLVRNTNAHKAIESNQLLNLSSADDVDIEVLVSIKPDWFFVYPYGHGSYEKYTSKGIRCFPVSEYLEKHPLGRVEWIKVFAAVCGADSLAQKTFHDIEKEYLKLKEENASRFASEKPCVFTGSQEGGVWYAPPGNSFQAILINDAGGNYILSDSISNKNLTLPFESLMNIAFECDYWGRVEYSPQSLTYQKIADEDQRYKKLNAFQNKQIFYCNTNVRDYFGDAILEPHLILQDLTEIFHPSKADYKFHYFEPVFD
jgi:iron complex transport system substrate-binding protein